MKTITILNCEFTACTAIAATIGDTERQTAVLVHDLKDEFHDGDFIAFGYNLPEDEEDAQNIIDDFSSHSTDAEDLKTVETEDELFEEQLAEVTPAWYAVEMDENDNDWGTGSFDYDEAVAMARRMEAKFIAVIRLGDDPVCERVIDLTEEAE